MRRLLWIAVFVVACNQPDEESPKARTLRPSYVPEFYTSQRLEAQVVDGANGKPIAGAAVLAVWRQVTTFTERWESIYLMQEAVTDANGRFTIHRWGPRVPPKDAFLDRRDPELWVIKCGYLVGYFDNAGESVVRLRDEDVQRGAIHYVKLPPYRMLDWERGKYARTADAGSRWNSQVLRLQLSADAGEIAASLRAANPLDPYLPHTLYPIREFWAEWERCRADLPVALHAKVTFPPQSIIDFTVRPAH